MSKDPGQCVPCSVYEQIVLFPFFQPILLHNSCLKSHKISHGSCFPLRQLPWGICINKSQVGADPFQSHWKKCLIGRRQGKKLKCPTSIGMPMWVPNFHVGFFFLLTLFSNRTASAEPGLSWYCLVGLSVEAIGKGPQERVLVKDTDPPTSKMWPLMSHSNALCTCSPRTIAEVQGASKFGGGVHITYILRRKHNARGTGVLLPTRRVRWVSKWMNEWINE